MVSTPLPVTSVVSGDVLPGVGDERHGAEVVDLVGVGVAERADQAGQVGQVAVVQAYVGEQALGRGRGGVVLAADEAVHVVPLGQQSSARYSPSCPVIPVMSADGMRRIVPAGARRRSLRDRSADGRTLARMKVLVTGGAGYIGSTTAKALEEAGHMPVILDSLLTGPRVVRPRPDLLRGRHRRPRAAAPGSSTSTPTSTPPSTWPPGSSCRSRSRSRTSTTATTSRSRWSSSTQLERARQAAGAVLVVRVACTRSRTTSR